MNEVIPENGQKAPVKPATVPELPMHEQIRSALTATVARIGNTKKTASAKRTYLSWVKMWQGFSVEDREAALADLRKLADTLGTTGDHDSALTAARLFVGSSLT